MVALHRFSLQLSTLVSAGNYIELKPMLVHRSLQRFINYAYKPYSWYLFQKQEKTI